MAKAENKVKGEIPPAAFIGVIAVVVIIAAFALWKLVFAAPPPAPAAKQSTAPPPAYILEKMSPEDQAKYGFKPGSASSNAAPPQSATTIQLPASARVGLPPGAVAASGTSGH